MRGHGAQSDNAAPIMQDEMHAVEFELVKQRFAYPFLVSRNGIILHARGFLRTSHADHVNGNGAKARLGQSWHNFAPHETPGRIAVDQHHGRTVFRPGFDIVHVEHATFIIIDCHIIWREVVIGQVFKPMVRCLAKFHGSNINADGWKVNN